MANIELDGANKKITVDSGDLTLDIPGDIILDADGAIVTFKDGGTSILDISNSSSDAVITSSVQDKDIIFKGDDGGSAITALTLDMSDAGAATFNGAITGGGLLTTGGNIIIPNAGNIGSASDTDAMAIASNGVVTFSQNPVFPNGGIDILDLDIDGGTDIGANIADADLFIIDDGAGGTNRKTAASRLKTYIGGGIDCDADSWLYRGNVLDQDSAAVVDFPTAEKLGSNVTESAGRFTVATAGWYLIYCRLANNSGASDNTNVWLRKNTTRQQGSIYWEGNTEINYLANSMTVIVEASANDIFDIYGSGNWSGNTDNTGLSWFMGVRLGA